MLYQLFQEIKEKKMVEELTRELTRNCSSDEDKMERIFNYVRDEIIFGWVYPQSAPAEDILKLGMGVCMQKANLLVQMARAAGFKARFHFMYVHKTALEDFLPGFAYKKWEDPFPHTFPEVFINGKWVSMEATFDKALHQICIERKLNFAKNSDVANNISIDFSIEGVKGHQQYSQAENTESFYGDDLEQFTDYLHKDVPWWKRQLQPLIFRKANLIMENIRKKD